MRLSNDPYLDRLNSLNKKAEVANWLHAAQLAQQQRLIQLNKEILGVEQQRLAEERTYRFKMWLQTPDGTAFTAWYNNATELVAGIQTFDDAWQSAWRHEFDALVSGREREQVRSGRYLARPPAIGFKRLLPPLIPGIAMVLLLIVIISTVVQDGVGARFWISLGLLALAAGALTWTLMFDDSPFKTEEEALATALRSQRIHHFGADPVIAGPPSWSVDDEHSAIQRRIQQTIDDAPVSLPGPRELPPLVPPRVVDGERLYLLSHRTLIATDFFRGGPSAMNGMER